jgi:hypothetical protein
VRILSASLLVAEVDSFPRLESRVDSLQAMNLDLEKEVNALTEALSSERRLRVAAQAVADETIQSLSRCLSANVRVMERRMSDLEGRFRVQARNEDALRRGSPVEPLLDGSFDNPILLNPTAVARPRFLLGPGVNPHRADILVPVESSVEDSEPDSSSEVGSGSAIIDFAQEEEDQERNRIRSGLGPSEHAEITRYLRDPIPEYVVVPHVGEEATPPVYEDFGESADPF